jgi:hypothetical protein
MAGHAYGSPMKVASTDSSSMASRKREGRECPYCNVPLVRIQSKQPATKDEWFLVCPYNVKVSILDITNLSLAFDGTLIAANLCRVIQLLVASSALSCNMRPSRNRNGSGELVRRLEEGVMLN